MLINSQKIKIFVRERKSNHKNLGQQNYNIEQGDKFTYLGSTVNNNETNKI